ncbi:MAG: hypothetical protein OXM55_01470, partial [Bdellovibrionales bacterium]|nr:hypothetical protein [Bdellovibrionales bacterium]
ESIQQMMRSNLQAFSTAKRSEVEKTIKYIENLIGKNKVKEKMKTDLYSVNRLKQFQLEQWEREWGRDTLITNLKRYNWQYLLYSYSPDTVSSEKQCMRGFQL